MLKSFLSHPLTRGIDLNSPETTYLRRRIIQEKKFLQRIYEEWYQSLVNSIPEREGIVLEIGSGAGFLKKFFPDVMTSECFSLNNIDMVIDARNLPFVDESLKAIVMTNVFHHLPQPMLFLREAARCLVPGGVVAMVEPWVTPWSRFVYSKLHHEPFHPEEQKWEFESEGPLSGANGALPWIVFQRDRKQFEIEFSQLRISNIEPMMPFRYLLSGGLSLISLQPGWTFRFWRFLESLLARWMDECAMYAKIALVREEQNG
ncbi:MAG TPA: class I SAM-dependent methyltransferase [Deltaproteobacteria bacterium]|nr:class I SAM-dependent methyltransferase [Deltaproteobacteria bacterium]